MEQRYDKKTMRNEDKWFSKKNDWFFKFENLSKGRRFTSKKEINYSAPNFPVLISFQDDIADL